MKVDKAVLTVLSIAAVGVSSIVFIMTGYGDIGGGVLIGAGMVNLMFVLWESLVSFTKRTEIELASRSLFALAAILVGLYILI